MLAFLQRTSSIENVRRPGPDGQFKRLDHGSTLFCRLSDKKKKKKKRRRRSRVGHYYRCLYLHFSLLLLAGVVGVALVQLVALIGQFFFVGRVIALRKTTPTFSSSVLAAATVDSDCQHLPRRQMNGGRRNDRASLERVYIGDDVERSYIERC